jgi:uncharacterized protein (DUF362 family)
MIDRREFLRTLCTAAATLAVGPDRLFAGTWDAESAYFGLHPFIDGHPEAVFVMHTQVADKLDSAAKKRAGLAFGQSVFVPMAIPGTPVSRPIVIKPNLTCRARSHPAYTIERSMGIVTDVFFVEGVIEGLKTLGMSGGQIHIREANCPGDLADGGYLEMATRTGADIEVLNSLYSALPPSALQWMDVPDGIWFRRIPYLWPVNAPETFLINIAKLKAHGMGLTLCAKNLQGTIANGYVQHCRTYGQPMGMDPADVRAGANTTILANYDRHVADGIPRWDRPGDEGGLWQETWATRCLDNNTITKPALHVIEGIYGRDGNFMDGPSPEGLATDRMMNVILFGKDPFRVDTIGHWLGGHEPGNFGLFHLAMERGLATVLDPHRIPVYTWHADGSALLTPLASFTRTPLETYYLRRDYNGQNESYWHLVDEPYTYPVDVPIAADGGRGPSTLGLPFPNPITRGTSIPFTLAREDVVRLDVVDVSGRVVAVLAEGRIGGGSHLVRWDTGRQPAGVYYCRLRGAGVRATRSIVVIPRR